MPTSVKIPQSEVTPGCGKVVEVGGKQVAVFNVGGTFHAIDNTCLHQGGPLGEGSLDEATVTCPWHGWEYDVTTGQCQTMAAATVARYPIRIEGSDIIVEVP